MDSLHAICVTTLEEALAYIRREIPTAEKQQACAAVNQAASVLEMLTGRRLAFRTYRTQVSGLTSSSVDSTIINLEGIESSYVGDWCIGDNLRPGSAIASISSDVGTLNNAATATGSLTLTLGSAPLLMDSPGCEPGEPFQFYLPEYPLGSIFYVYELLDDGTTRLLSDTGMRTEPETGLVILPDDSVARGSMNLQVHYSAGLRFPAGNVTGHPDAYTAQLATHRLAQVNFQDWSQASGRATDMAIGSVSRRADSFTVPQDVRGMVQSLMRRLM